MICHSFIHIRLIDKVVRTQRNIRIQRLPQCGLIVPVERNNFCHLVIAQSKLFVSLLSTKLFF